ncbi:Solute carrier family 35 member G1 [Holothuria leucospilota]|uniref:Solute carrier family 35 member G1 n=1 Tax=Holothuria leucospilota TaxID=206669 RepID=A0A9Q1C993_HOLLE|nr:Solute carrier family 35 member G1 [Holothuria leucospilota]
MEVDHVVTKEIEHMGQLEVLEENESPSQRSLCPTSFFHRYAGSFITVLAVLVMSFADTCVELSTQTLNSFLVTVLFSSSMFIEAFCCTVISGKIFECRRYEKSAVAFLVLCGLSNSGALTLINAAIAFIPVGDAISILRSMPVFAGLFGWILVGQRMKIIDCILAICCIVGVALIARPSFIFHTPGADHESEVKTILGVALALGSAIAFALSFVIGRKLSDKNVHSFVIISVNALFTVLLNSGLVTILQQWSHIDDFCPVGISLLGGSLHAVGQILVFIALSKERAVVVTVILASEIIYVYTLQILIVQLIPHWLSGVGALIILFACVGMAISEAQQNKEGE